MSHRTVVAMAFAGICTALVSAVAWWGHLVMLAGWSLLGLWATRTGCDGRNGPDDRSMT